MKTTVTQNNWRDVTPYPRTIFDILNKSFVQLQEKHPDSFPNLRNSKDLLLGSDYSGESPDAPYYVFSYLITSLENWSEWEYARLIIRQKIFSDSRRMSFKNLGDNQRRKALIPFLEAANSLNGLSFSIAINKKCKSLFSHDSPLDLENPDFIPYRKWKPDVLVKAFTIIHFLSFLIAGLCEQGQNIYWFTDEDNIAANDQRVCELTNLVAWIINDYISFPLGHLRCGTSCCDNGTRQIEDFIAIPDLIAGALSEQLKMNANALKIPNVFWIYSGDFSEKAKTITWWFSQCGFPLKRLFCTINPCENGIGEEVSFFHFYNQC
ncbi:hypothetical protein L9W92_01595 [Pelotomaculum terephthalicicum JT]|uniref:hypothetical protein n=1 Tax=Pelotomaculum TaxID=191373 RepID=UPI0009CA3BFB|nr:MULTISPECIES: hypothetical protein [Pelotomaculum]MCG9966751.1 hypothetical protein [Pelotomaculum terephthalicicum JT]OPX85559.1 MAG: hypothetical protein A4E54_02368 [Pelotomaculum sp. PtaB.Bin117]OPY61741.1 MAG: hypothetical protein A4E56_01860 [Pelotomaculum sp. PtaU1.Bin065]